MEAGFKYPEPFTVKADDGITDLYGTMYKPFDFDPAKKYPVILYVYPGPQTESVTKTFIAAQRATSRSPTSGSSSSRSATAAATRRGRSGTTTTATATCATTACRTRRRRSSSSRSGTRSIDLERVGIYGPLGRRLHDGRGDVRVSPTSSRSASPSPATTTTRIYNRWWSEKHDGVKEVVKDDKVDVPVRHRQEPGHREEPEGPPAADHGRHRQQRAPVEHVSRRSTR